MASALRSGTIKLTLSPSPLAVRIQTTNFLSVVTDLGPSLAYVMPAIEERLGRQWAYDLDMKVFVRDLDGACCTRRSCHPTCVLVTHSHLHVTLYLVRVCRRQPTTPSDEAGWCPRGTCTQ